VIQSAPLVAVHEQLLPLAETSTLLLAAAAEKVRDVAESVYVHGGAAACFTVKV
jgi:hypothetical protein